MADLFHVIWSHAVDGYEWVSAIPAFEPDSETSRFITEPSRPGQRRDIEEYPVLHTETGLFRNFVETEPTEEGILKFANRYGLLGGVKERPGEKPTSIRKHILPHGENVMTEGESFADWADSIHAMRNAVTLWALIKDENHEKLRELIVWSEHMDRVSYRSRKGILRNLARMKLGEAFHNLKRLNPGDEFRAAIASENHHPEQKLSAVYGLKVSITRLPPTAEN